MLSDALLSPHFTLAEFCTCTQTYRRFADQIDPWPSNPAETLPALQALCHELLEPLVAEFGREALQLTYGFCSADLKRWLARKDPQTGQKYGRVAPSRDQHMACERDRQGRYYCDRLGAACDLYLDACPSDRLAAWIVARELPFDSIYYYGSDRPLHLSHGPQHKRALWCFTASGTPRRWAIVPPGRFAIAAPSKTGQ